MNGVCERTGMVALFHVLRYRMRRFGRLGEVAGKVIGLDGRYEPGSARHLDKAFSDAFAQSPPLLGRPSSFFSDPGTTVARRDNLSNRTDLSHSLPSPMLPTDCRKSRLPLKRAVRAIKAKTALYRRVFFASLAAVFLLSAGFAWQTHRATAPVLLGTGEAGVYEIADASEPLAADDAVAEAEPVPLEQQEGRAAGEGRASFYAREFAGRRTASGERFNPQAMTAAHRTLPMGSKVRVTNVRNGRTVIVRINDRGPFTGGRVIDLSHAAAQQLGFIRSGTAQVRMELLNG
jgi:rare lipoprotein A